MLSHRRVVNPTFIAFTRMTFIGLSILVFLGSCTQQATPEAPTSSHGNFELIINLLGGPYGAKPSDLVDSAVIVSDRTGRQLDAVVLKPDMNRKPTWGGVARLMHASISIPAREPAIHLEISGVWEAWIDPRIMANKDSMAIACQRLNSERALRCEPGDGRM